MSATASLAAVGSMAAAPAPAPAAAPGVAAPTGVPSAAPAPAASAPSSHVPTTSSSTPIAVSFSGERSDPSASFLLNLLFSSCLSQLGPGSNLTSPAVYRFVAAILSKLPVPGGVTLRDQSKADDIVLSGHDALSVSDVKVRRAAASPSQLHLVAMLSLRPVTVHLKAGHLPMSWRVGYEGPVKFDLDCSAFPQLQATCSVSDDPRYWKIDLGKKDGGAAGAGGASGGGSHDASAWMTSALEATVKAVGNAVLDVSEKVFDNGLQQHVIKELAKVHEFHVNLVPKTANGTVLR